MPAPPVPAPSPPVPTAAPAPPVLAPSMPPEPALSPSPPSPDGDPVSVVCTEQARSTPGSKQESDTTSGNERRMEEIPWVGDQGRWGQVTFLSLMSALRILAGKKAPNKAPGSELRGNGLRYATSRLDPLYRPPSLAMSVSRPLLCSGDLPKELAPRRPLPRPFRFDRLRPARQARIQGGQREGSRRAAVIGSVDNRTDRLQHRSVDPFRVLTAHRMARTRRMRRAHRS